MLWWARAHNNPNLHNYTNRATKSSLCYKLLSLNSNMSSYELGFLEFIKNSLSSVIFYIFESTIVKLAFEALILQVSSIGSVASIVDIISIRISLQSLVLPQLIISILNMFSRAKIV